MKAAALVLACLAAPALGAEGQGPGSERCDSTVAGDCQVAEARDPLAESVQRGRRVFASYCVLCHGEGGKGDGRAARLHRPPPANLTASTQPRDYLALMVRWGGEAMGRGKGMPAWGSQLSTEQIDDAVNFVMTLRSPRF